MLTALYYLSWLLLIQGLLLWPSVITAANEARGDLVGGFLTASLVNVGIGAAFVLALRGNVQQPDRTTGLTVLVAGWPFLALFAMIPFLLMTDLSVSGAWFETVSGLTTTGLSIFGRVDELPLAIKLWRAVMQWFGGLLTLLVGLMILSPLGSGGLKIRHLSLDELANRQKWTRFKRLVAQMVLAYASTTLLCQLWLTAAGTSAFDALCLALSTVSTGGFSPRDAPIDTFVGPLGQIGLILFMVIGATNIHWQGAFVRFNLRVLSEHRETNGLILAIALLGAVIALLALSAAGASMSPAQAFREGLFTSASLLSTTGFHIREEAFSVVPWPAVLVLVLIGGASLSTAGGLKCFRVGILAVHAERELLHSLYANAVRRTAIGAKRWTISDIGAVWVFFAASVLMLALGMAIISIELPFDAAVTAAVATFTNAGPIYGAGPEPAFPWPTVADLSPGMQVMLTLSMMIGRIELVGLLGLLFMPAWKGSI